jgi:hypothetical protein
MKEIKTAINRLVFLTTSLFASSILVSAPTQAATFARSTGVFEFTRFSQNPLSVGTFVDNNTFTIATNGLTRATASATAIFLQNPAQGFSTSTAEALGENRDYLGTAASEARLIGEFLIDSGQNFSFDFTSLLNLETEIDNPPAENARASGDISLAVLNMDTKEILDFFSLTGSLQTEGDMDFLATQQSSSITSSNLVNQSQFGGNKESARGLLAGLYQRTFANKTNLRVVEVKRNLATVKTPEASSGIAFVVYGGVIALFLKKKLQD